MMIKKEFDRVKKTGFTLVVVMCMVLLSIGCKKDDPKPEPEPPPVGEVILLGDGSEAYEIKSDMTLSYPNTYVLQGWIYVVDGATLTIEPGVIIKGDKASKATLIVERGAKIMAQGTKERPIVFTSAQAPGQRKPGDWGGLIICGRAPNNAGELTIEGGVRSLHGGSNPNDNSGVLSYVRVEFAGIEYEPDNEINGITMGSVGAGTKIDHVQVSYPGDDSFEWFGGTVNAKYLVSLGCWDDDYDTDNGFSGKIQFAVALRDPLIADQSASNGFESDNNSSGSDDAPFTTPVFANISIFGPVANPTNYTDQGGINGHWDQTKVRFQAGLHLRRNTKLNIFNSVIAGWPIGVIIENSGRGDAQGNAERGELNVTNCVLAGCVKNFQDAQYWAGSPLTVYNNEDHGDFGEPYFTRSNGKNRIFATLAELKLGNNPLNLNGSGFFPQSDSPLASGAEWSHPSVSTWFDKVSYIGAFSPTETASNNWMTGWTNFDPQNTEY